MRSSLRAVCMAAAWVCWLPGAAFAQSPVVKVWPGVAPGSEKWTQQEKAIGNTPLGTMIFNVVTPTLTAYLPGFTGRSPRRGTSPRPTSSAPAAMASA